MSFAASPSSVPSRGHGTARPGLVVAIDGPSGSGKSSVARGVAQRLGLRFLDTGAQYRALTFWMLRHGVDVADADAVAIAAGKPHLDSGTDPSAPTILIDGVDASVEIRTAEVTAAVSAVSAVPTVRQRLVALQREIIGDGGIVVEGRDIAAVVAPDAPAKIFLTASEETRAKRRNAENGGGSATVGTTREAIARRDSLDAKTNVLDAAPGAVVVDATDLTLSQVIEKVSAIALASGSATPAADSQGGRRK
jgi:cytidylate kinase